MESLFIEYLIVYSGPKVIKDLMSYSTITIDGINFSITLTEKIPPTNGIFLIHIEKIHDEVMVRYRKYQFLDKYVELE